MPVIQYRYDELLVGAPLYRANATQPDTGRVYVYRNNMVKQLN